MSASVSIGGPHHLLRRLQFGLRFQFGLAEIGKPVYEPPVLAGIAGRHPPVRELQLLILIRKQLGCELHTQFDWQFPTVHGVGQEFDCTGVIQLRQ